MENPRNKQFIDFKLHGSPVDLMPNDLRWNWCNNNNNRNEVHNKCHLLNHPLIPGPWTNCLPWNQSPEPKRLGIIVDNSEQCNEISRHPAPSHLGSPTFEITCSWHATADIVMAHWFRITRSRWFSFWRSVVTYTMSQGLNPPHRGIFIISHHHKKDE